MDNDFEQAKTIIEHEINLPNLPVQPCEHKWVFQRSDYQYIYSPYGIDEYRRYDTYYCEKCLKISELLAASQNSRERPYWYKE